MTTPPEVRPLRPRRSTVRLALVVGLVLALAATAQWFRQRARAAAAAEAVGPVFSVIEGPLTIGVTQSGTVKPREQEILKSEIEGRATILFLISEGTRVQKGELLVELDGSTLLNTKLDQEIRKQNADAAFIQSRENLEVVRNQAQSDIDKAELTLRFAGEDLAQYQDGEYPNALKEREARITLAREELQRAEEKFTWSRALFEEKYLSESELQADDLAVRKARLDVDLAENNLSLLREFTYRRQVAQLESDAKQAEMALERVRRKAAADVVQAEVNLRVRESELQRETEKLQKIEEQIVKTRIVAPRDGLVVYATSARADWRGGTEPLAEGQEVRERQELIYLPTTSEFVAEIKVHESSLDKIRIGMPVRVTVDAVPGRRFSGRVAIIAPLPDAMSLFMNPDLKVYNTVVHIEGGGDALRTGMSCQAEIVVEQFASALYVPVQAVLRVQGQTSVYRREAGTFVLTPVEIGLDNNRMVRIVSGLQRGDEVLLAPPLDAAGVREEQMPEPAVEPQVAPAAAVAPVAVVAPGGEGDAAAAAAASGEERERMRRRFESLSPEERAALRQRAGEGGRAARGAENRGAP